MELATLSGFLITLLFVGGRGGQEKSRRGRNGTAEPEGQSRRSYHHNQQVHKCECQQK